MLFSSEIKDPCSSPRAWFVSPEGAGLPTNRPIKNTDSAARERSE